MWFLYACWQRGDGLSISASFYAGAARQSPTLLLAPAEQPWWLVSVAGVPPGPSGGAPPLPPARPAQASPLRSPRPSPSPLSPAFCQPLSLSLSPLSLPLSHLSTRTCPGPAPLPPPSSPSLLLFGTSLLFHVQF